ncbi:hypothetical protein BJ165DRAFT_1425794 [Panaeolus papilionaceus]|nr:hypothetical protein BJ165DRAFT_1425794 [Panaeolus papilionaceus]
MTTSNQVTLFRGLVHELRRSSSPPRKLNKSIVAQFRALAEHSKDAKHVAQDLQNATLFLYSQREHRRLLERYNPLFDLTAEERIKATARRVGLDMPVTHKEE